MTNLLKNPSLEGEYTERGAPEIKIAPDWAFFFDKKDTRPEWKPATLQVDASRVRDGQTAQQWFNWSATHTAGIRQRVTGIEFGRLLRFSAWVQAWTSTEDDPETSVGGKYRMRIGINPYGGNNQNSPDIVWCEAVLPHDAYQQLTVECDAKADRCTVFVWGQPEWPVKHNNAYVDSCVLEYIGEPPPAPGPGTCPTLDEIVEAFEKSLLAMIDQINDPHMRQIVREELANRDPVRWPR